jgi:ABC-type tungstate transport system substrate-binding protein
MDDRGGDNLGRWGLVFGMAGAAIGLVLLLLPLVIWLALWFATYGLPAPAGD